MIWIEFATMCDQVSSLKNYKKIKSHIFVMTTVTRFVINHMTWSHADTNVDNSASCKINLRHSLPNTRQGLQRNLRNDWQNNAKVGSEIKIISSRTCILLFAQNRLKIIWEFKFKLQILKTWKSLLQTIPLRSKFSPRNLLSNSQRGKSSGITRGT